MPFLAGLDIKTKAKIGVYFGKLRQSVYDNNLIV